MNSRFLVTLGGSLFAFSSPSLGIDLNGDGVSDVYAALYPSISATSPESDFDGDGQSNLMESGALTNPEDPTDNLKCLPLVDGGAHYTIKWSSKSGLTYQVQHSNDGDVWTDIGAPRAGGAGFSSATVEKASLTQGEGDFFRVKTSGVIDSDGDGIPDWEEELLGFDPTRSASVRSAASGGDRQQLINIIPSLLTAHGLLGRLSQIPPS